MKKLLIASLMVAVLAFGVAAATTDSATHSFNADVDDMAVIAIAGTAVELCLVAPTEGNEGNTPIAQTDNTCSLEYTVVTASSKKITVAKTSGTIPLGCLLTVVSADPGADPLGAEQAAVDLASGGDLIITILSCNTAAAGPNITYSLSVDTMTSLVPGDANLIEVTFTILDTA